MRMLDTIRSKGTRARKVLEAYRAEVPKVAPFGRRGRALHELGPELRERIRRERVRFALRGVTPCVSTG